MLRKITKNKRGQIDFSPIVFVAILITLLLMAPIMMRIMGTVTGQFFKTMNESYPEAVKPATKAVDTVYNFFDYLIVIALFVNVIVLFISAWFIDTNPVFIVLYIMFAFILILFLPNMIDAVDAVWSKMDDASSLDEWEGSSLELTFTEFLKNNAVLVTLVIIMISGIITYAKFKIS